MARHCTCSGEPGAYCARCEALLARAEGRVMPAEVHVLFHGPQTAQEQRSFRTPHKTSKAYPSPVAAPGRQQPPKIDRYRSDAERRYAVLLDQWQREEDIARWWYEPMKLWLAPKTTITIDFLIRRYGGEPLELHEVKSVWYREDGLVKLKIAAAMYPCYRVILANWADHQWHWTTMPAV